jgi:hypothetical protein
MMIVVEDKTDLAFGRGIGSLYSLCLIVRFVPSIYGCMPSVGGFWLDGAM